MSCVSRVRVTADFIQSVEKEDTMSCEADGRELRRRAEKRVKAVTNFKKHALVYCLVNGVIFIT